eukprot:Gb_08219 [translate_table: standard]
MDAENPDANCRQPRKRFQSGWIFISCFVITTTASIIISWTLYFFHLVRIAFPILSLIAFVASLIIVIPVFLRKGHVSDYEAREAKLRKISQPFLRISEEELLQATANFNHGKIIGKGRFGTVYKGLLSNGYTVAIKRFQLDETSSRKHALSEVKILGQLRHRNLLRILGYFFNGNEMVLISEFMPNLSLDILLHGPAQCILDWRQRLNIAVGVAHGLAYLHHECRNTIVHCDLKPSNILLDENMEAHIADFGVARVINDKDVTESSFGPRFTAGYAAPEKAYDLNPSSKGDVYSFGILLLELITGIKPTSSRFEEGVTLYQWVKKAVVENDLVEVLDDFLKIDFELYHNEIQRFIRIAILCAYESPHMRPLMNDVMKGLEEIKEERQFNIPLNFLAEQMKPLPPLLRISSMSTSTPTSS